MMHRHKANVEIKQVIITLCKLMASTGVLHVPAPETFRRAKFAEHKAEEEFWQLLANILQSKNVSSTGWTQTKNVTSECKMLVRTGLWKSGYYAGWLYDKKVEGVSSRELLLAFGWLLAAGTLEELLIRRVQQLDKTLLPPVLIKFEIPQEPVIDCTSIRQLQWLVGFLRHQGRILLSMQDEQASLFHAFLSLGQPSPSSGQRCPALNEICNDAQQLSEIFELYLKWKELENIFWTWMDSVVDYRENDAVTKRPTHSTRGDVTYHAGQLALEKLDKILLRLKTLQLEGQETGKMDIKDGKWQRQDGLDICSEAPPLNSLPPRLLVSHPYRAKLLTTKTVKSSSVLTFQGTLEEADELPVSQVIELLTHAERQLLDERDIQSLANRMQLQEMFARLHKLLLIPP
ncbi:tubulin epsilon and delta complex protein 1 [Stigmatopora argus]